MCNFYLSNKRRHCRRSPNKEYCFQHLQTISENKPKPRLASLLNHKPKPKSKPIDESEPENCAVCFDSCVEKTSCGHSVHYKCIVKWGKNQCPSVGAWISSQKPKSKP